MKSLDEQPHTVNVLITLCSDLCAWQLSSVLVVTRSGSHH